MDSKIQESKDKSIIQGIGYKEFTAICDEYQIVEQATKELLEIAKTPKTPIRVKVDIYKWVVEMNIGKPKQMNDITLQNDDEKLIVNFQTNLGSDDIVKAISKKYSIPYEELKEYEYQIGIRVDRSEYENSKGEVDIDRVMSDVEKGIIDRG